VRQALLQSLFYTKRSNGFWSTILRNGAAKLILEKTCLLVINIVTLMENLAKIVQHKPTLVLSVYVRSRLAVEISRNWPATPCLHNFAMIMTIHIFTFQQQDITRETWLGLFAVFYWEIDFASFAYLQSLFKQNRAAPRASIPVQHF